MNQSPYIHEVTQETFARQVLETSQRVPVLVDFWAVWCAPCQMLMPVLAHLAEEYQGKFVLAKVNTDEQQALAVQYGVRSLPTVKVFRNEQVVDEFMGAQPEGMVRALLGRHVERASDKLRDQAMALFDAGDVDAALALLDRAQALEPERDKLHLDQARVLMQSGRAAQAQRVLSGLPADVALKPEAMRLRAELDFWLVAAGAPEVRELAQRIDADPADLDARYQLSAVKVLNRDYDTALEQLFEIMRRDRTFKDDAGRRGLVAIFELLGDDPRVNRYRSRMFNLLH